ncbi:MAG: MATE family efflux transporter [Oscillospiraceae bacterium]|nr:MATE family efflux transporter [Oscillospiraceae bacterium]
MVKEKSFYKNLLMLSLPIAAQNIITYLVGLGDNVMVASLGETAVSGVYVANQITNLLQMFVAGISAALTVLAAQYWGRGDRESVKSIIAVAFKICLAVSALLWGVMFFFTGQVLGLFTNEPEVAAAGVEYTRPLCFTYLPFCMTNLLIASMRCVESVKIGSRSAAFALVSDLFLNWVFIYGKLGVPAMGVKGAAVSTVISRLLELSVVLWYVMKVDRKLKLRIRELFKKSPYVRDFFRYGAPVITGDLLWGLNLAAQGVIVGHLGTEAIAAVSIAGTMFTIIAVGSYGVRDGAAVIIGKTVGSGDVEKVKAYAKTLQVIFISVGAVTGLAILLSRGAVPLVYRRMDTATLQTARQLLTVLSVTVVGTSYQMASLTGIVRAGGSTHFVLVNDLIFVWLIVIPSAVVAAYVFGAPAWVVFACLKCDQILKCAVAVVKVNRFKWIKNLTRNAESVIS